MDSVPKNSGKTTGDGAYCPLQGSTFIFLFFILQKEYSVHGISLPSMLSSGIEEEEEVLFICSLPSTFPHQLFPPLYWENSVPASHYIYTTVLKFPWSWLLLSATLGRELRTRIGATDECCKQGQPASVPVTCVTPGFRIAMHHHHYMMKLLTINDCVTTALVEHFDLWAEFCFYFFIIFYLDWVLDHSFSLLKHL